MQHKHAQYTQNSVSTVNSITKNIDRGFSLLVAQMPLQK